MTVAEREWIRAHLRDLEDAEGWIVGQLDPMPDRIDRVLEGGAQLWRREIGLWSQQEELDEIIEINDLCADARERARDLNRQDWNALPLAERRHRAGAARKRFHGYLRDAKRRAAAESVTR